MKRGAGSARDRDAAAVQGDADGSAQLEDDLDDEEAAMRPPPPKSRRPGPAAQETYEFKRGTVRRVRLHDFMTFVGTVTINPGPRLNLVLGPNGTGKSTLVCALCVGLGGSPKLLGRADNLKDYVRRGCSECWTEITLASGDHSPDTVVKRTIRLEHRMEDGQRKARYATDYTINGQEVTQDEVKATIKAFNIQFDNLCQFLPQDKVSDFARMDAVELLVATEKALTDSQLYTLHQELIEGRQEVKAKDAEVTRTRDRLQGLQQEQDRQKREYERVATRERLKKEIRLIQDKLMWLRVVQAKSEEKEAKEHLKHVTAQLKELEQTAKQDEAPGRAAAAAATAAAKARDTAKGAVRRAQHDLVTAQTELEKVQEDQASVLETMKSLQSDSEKRAAKIVEIEREIRELDAAVERLPQGPTPEAVEQYKLLEQQVQRAKEQDRELEDQLRDARHEMAQVERESRRLEGQYQNLADARSRKLRAIAQAAAGGRGRPPPIVELHDWMVANSTKFRGPVYGPVALEVTLHPGPQSAMWARYLEKACGSSLLNFVASCREDERLLNERLGELGGNVSSITVAAVNHDFTTPLRHPRGEPDRLREYGITHTLDQLFDAPPLVKHMLADLSKVNQAYVGDERTRDDSTSRALFSNTQVQDVYSGELFIRYSVSRYNSAAKTYAVDGVPPARYLGGESLAQVEEDRARIGAQLQQAQQELEVRVLDVRRLEAQRAALHRTTEEAREAMGQIESQIQGVASRRARLMSDRSMKVRRLQMARNEPEPLDRAPALAAQNQQYLGVMADQGGRLAGLAQAYWQAMRVAMARELEAKERHAQAEAVKAAVVAQRTALGRTRDLKGKAERVYEAAKRKFDEAKAQAQAEAPRSEERDAAMSDLPDEADELRALAEEKQAAADAIVCSDEGVIRAYTERQRVIDELTGTVAEGEAQLAERNEALAAKKEAWLPTLAALVEGINERFSANFAEIGCAGEVALKEDEGGDFDKYAIQIRVKFRLSEPLQVLTANRQSGGERSVSTILYLIALQGVTQTPFRVVDEINQGMDPVNERKVFIQLVESSCKPDTPQCFLLTPKLLPGLPYERQIAILNIMNGAGLEPSLVADWDRGVRTGGAAAGLAMILGKRMRAAVPVA